MSNARSESHMPVKLFVSSIRACFFGDFAIKLDVPARELAVLSFATDVHR